MDVAAWRFENNSNWFSNSWYRDLPEIKTIKTKHEKTNKNSLEVGSVYFDDIQKWDVIILFYNSSQVFFKVNFKIWDDLKWYAYIFKNNQKSTDCTVLSTSITLPIISGSTDHKLTWYIPNQNTSKWPTPCSVYLEWKNIQKILLEKKSTLWNVLGYIKWKVANLLFI